MVTPELLPISLPFHFQFSQNFSPTHIFLFLTKINPPLSGQISDETWYTWLRPALTIYSEGHTQNQKPLATSLKPT